MDNPECNSGIWGSNLTTTPAGLTALLLTESTPLGLVTRALGLYPESL
jgi:hypothetical protein